MTSNSTQSITQKAEIVEIFYSKQPLLPFLAAKGENFIRLIRPSIHLVRESEVHTGLLKPISVKANGKHDKNDKPENVMDDNPTTRWSQQGKGSNITLDLGGEQQIEKVKIGWYMEEREAGRINNYEVALSANGTDFSSVGGHKESNSRESVEIINPSQKARYVKLTVNGSSRNDWASITNVEVYGKQLTSTLQEDKGRQTTSDMGQGTSGGVLQIYVKATKPAMVCEREVGNKWPEPFIMGEGNWKDRADQWGQTNEDNTIVTASSNEEERMNVKSYPDYNQGEAEKKHDVSLERGYMSRPDDWYNIEQTGYWNITEKASNKDDQDVVQYMNGERHPSGQGESKHCTGCAYKGALNYIDGRTRWRKEETHNDYRDDDWKDSIDFDMVETERWVGIKTVRFEYKRENGSYAVRLELWIDDGENNKPSSFSNNWRLVNVDEDYIGKVWSEDDGNDCGCGCPKKHYPLLFKYPYCTYRSDNTGAEISGVTVFEIVPPTPDKFYKEGNIVSPTK